MSDSDSSQHDDLLFNMLKECKTLPVFLNHIFGFLQRRTDFYLEAADPNTPVGLPKGLAESLVRHAYFKWKPTDKCASTIPQKIDIPQPVVEEVVTTGKMVENELEDNISSITIDQNKEPSNQKVHSKTNAIFSQSESYNGGIHENYCWSQSISDIDISIGIPENTSAKDLQLSILPQKVSVKLKDSILLEGELCHKCKNSDAVWSTDKHKVLIHLDKCKEIWWDCLLTSEERLDLSKIDCSRPFEELPEDAQAKIEELTWNQERKRLGLPTSDELSKQELLRRAWNAEGSPFSGPFDPSQVVLQ